jgi:alkylation response protein AidB-like acyl-CoA dehydrogenase
LPEFSSLYIPTLPEVSMSQLKAAVDAPSLLRAVEDLVPLVREFADQGEQERRLPDPLVKAFTETGVFRMCRPKGLGGLEVDPLTVIRVCERLAWADGAAGWCAMITGAGSVFAGIMPPAGATEIFADKDTRSNGSFAITGQAREVEGGFRISGRWSFMSGSTYSDWLGGGCVVMDGEAPRMGPMGPDVVVPLWKMSDCTLLDTWHVAGLRGSGSNDVEVKDVFVPESHCVRFPPKGPTQPGALYTFPFFGFLAMSISACSIGIARAALDELIGIARVKTPFGMFSSLSTRPTAQIAVAEADAGLRAARAFLIEATESAWKQAQSGEPLRVEDRRLMRLAATNATLASARAVDLAYTTGGGSALYAKNRLQRCFRDLHAITQHATVASHTYEMLGQLALGVIDDAPLL